jgi:DNA-binding transcriptional regulator YiaG
LNRMKVGVANKVLQKALQQAVATLNNWQTDERLPQNMALTMPQEIEGCTLMYVEVFEEIA